ncbi:MAG: S8 family serine peptidase [Bryobacteraceae bacterium]
MLKHYLVATLLLVTAGSGLFAAGPARKMARGFAPNRYAVILNDPPVAEKFAALKVTRGAAVDSYRQQILGGQTALRAEIEKQNVHVTGAVQTLLNAVFVAATKDQAAQLRGLDGVKAVVPLRRYKVKLDQAVLLTNVNPGAWNALGGVGNAGAGMKIGILDGGIDQTHPAFQDASLTTPAGFPKCDNAADCAFTTNKVIAARSYVAMLAAGTPPDPAVNSMPDDVSMHDHAGHGTALAMVAAGETNTGPADTITGVAPKAFLGSYKIYGSPGVNEAADDATIVAALEDALKDGMDVAVLSIGGGAFSGPLDQGAACVPPAPAGTPCDLSATGVENAVNAGMMVVVAAGNDGGNGFNVPTLNTVDSPGTAPSAIAAGASTNSHQWYSTVDVLGQNVPASLQYLAAVFGDGPEPTAPLVAPLRDVTPLDGTGLGCSAFPGGSLNGTIALIARGTCYFYNKVLNAQTAGAKGVILTQIPGDGAPISAEVAGTTIPEVMIGDTDGANLRAYLASVPNLEVAIDPTLRPVMVANYANQVAYFSSHGPSIDMRLKPEMAAVGTDLYMATSNFDPNGAMYDPSRYVVAQGTSFATPMIAGAVALVKQQNPSFTPWQLKSAVVNTATQNISEGGYTASAVSTGNGLLNGGNAVQTTVTVNPAAVSFGALVSGTTPPTETLTIHYSGSSAATLTLSAVSIFGTAPTLSKTSLSVAPGQADQTVTLTLPSSIPSANIYEGGIVIQGAGGTWRVPYIYVVGDGVFSDIPEACCVTDGTAGQNPMPAGEDGLMVRLIDDLGVPLAGYPVSFTVASGGGSIFNADTQTNSEGVAGAGAVLGSYQGIQVFDVNIGNNGTGGAIPLGFAVWARPLPVISAVTNAASLAQGPISPGSYIALFGSGLSDNGNIGQTATTALPLAILLPSPANTYADSNVSVSFDVPSAGISVPGRMLYVSPTQVNVQAPWELAGQQSVEMKVTVGTSFGQVYTAQVANYSPAVYLIPDTGTSQPVAAAEDLTGTVISSVNPAHASQQQTIQLYLNGLGPVSNPPAIGYVAQAQPLSTTVATPTVTIGGVAANVIWSGLTPTESGLYQINLTLAANTPTGTQPVVVSIGGISSPPVNIAVQ